MRSGFVLTSLCAVSKSLDLTDDLVDDRRSVSLGNLLEISERGDILLTVSLGRRPGEVGNKLLGLGDEDTRDRAGQGGRRERELVRSSAFDSAPQPVPASIH